MKLKKIIIVIVLLVILFAIGITLKRKYYDPAQRLKKANELVNSLLDKNQIKEGDIVFQNFPSGQSKAIELATHSIYTHCGIILKRDNELCVFEAVQPVKFSSLDVWIARDKNCSFVLKRLKDSDKILNEKVLESMRQIANELKGKDYDGTFEWSDDRMYCSELVWKIYKRTTGLEVGKQQKLKDFDLTDDIVKNKMKERYGSDVPYDEIVVSPAAIFDSDLLYTVKEK